MQHWYGVRSTGPAGAAWDAGITWATGLLRSDGSVRFRTQDVTPSRAAALWPVVRQTRKNHVFQPVGGAWLRHRPRHGRCQAGLGFGDRADTPAPRTAHCHAGVTASTVDYSSCCYVKTDIRLASVKVAFWNTVVFRGHGGDPGQIRAQAPDRHPRLAWCTHGKAVDGEPLPLRGRSHSGGDHSFVMPGAGSIWR
jgi:hypothetical protein